MIYTIEQYSNLRHKMYNTIQVYAFSGNVYSIYKNHIKEYDGLYKKEYGVQFTLKDNLTGYKITRTTKQSIINNLIKNIQL